MKSILFALVLCLGLVEPNTRAQEEDSKLASVPIIFNLPGPPVRGSAQDVVDYQTLLDYQSSRTQAECARANHEVVINVVNFFATPYGPLTATEAAKWQLFINQHQTRASLTIGAAKLRYHRIRPYKAHADIHPCITLPVDFSYPSGHSALAEYYGKILAIAFPERANAIGVRATQIAIDRNVGGVHYPTDVRDGLLLGDQIFETENKDGKLEALIHANFF